MENIHHTRYQDEHEKALAKLQAAGIPCLTVPDEPHIESCYPFSTTYAYGVAVADGTARLARAILFPEHRCSDCGKHLDVAHDKYWASTNLICDACYQTYPLAEDAQ
jgi:hypothetical protein